MKNGCRFMTSYKIQGARPSPRGEKCNKQNTYLRRPDK